MHKERAVLKILQNQPMTDGYKAWELSTFKAPGKQISRGYFIL